MKHELYTISEKSNNKLVISRKKNRHLQGAASLTLFLLFWIVPTYNIGNENNIRNLQQQLKYLLQHPEYWLHVFLIPVLMVLGIIRLLYVFFTGEEIIIDKSNGLISKQGKTQIQVTEVSHLQIRKYTDSDGDIDYRLSLVTTTNNKLFIDRSSNQDGIISFAEEIGDFLEKNIQFK